MCSEEWNRKVGRSISSTEFMQTTEEKKEIILGHFFGLVLPCAYAYFFTSTFFCT